jgi:hypothetical protein
MGKYDIMQMGLKDDYTVCSSAENLWLECDMVGDIMRQRDIINSSMTFDATVHFENNTYLTVVLFRKRLCQHLYVFAVSNKVSPPSVNTNKCSHLFPYFVNSERHDEQTVNTAEEFVNYAFLLTQLIFYFFISAAIIVLILV